MAHWVGTGRMSCLNWTNIRIQYRRYSKILFGLTLRSQNRSLSSILFLALTPNRGRTFLINNARLAARKRTFVLLQNRRSSGSWLSTKNRVLATLFRGVCWFENMRLSSRLLRIACPNRLRRKCRRDTLWSPTQTFLRESSKGRGLGLCA